ncbi:hypothetical protein JHK85_006983 [Glycine max]|nr:hypothetical protein JHK85_006983 [Glycine max]
MAEYDGRIASYGASYGAHNFIDPIRTGLHDLDPIKNTYNPAVVMNYIDDKAPVKGLRYEECICVRITHLGTKVTIYPKRNYKLFEALKAKSSSSSSSSVYLTIVTSSNSNAQFNEEESEDDEEAQVEKLQWAKDVARLDPSPPSDDEDI